MKNSLIIFISLFLLSSSVIGDNHKGETFYEWKTTSGIQWREIGDKDIHTKYKGDVGDWKNGLFHGQGIYTITSDGYNYVGEFRIGNLWNGTMKEKDGTIDYKVVNWKKIKQ